MLSLMSILIKIRVHGIKVKHVYRNEIRDIDYSKKYIRSLKKLFKQTRLYYFVLLALHTRNEKS